jgi:hypothetical protein
MPVVFVVALGLLIYLIVRLGPERIALELWRMSSVLPAVLVITGAKYWFQTAGWRLVLPPKDRPRWVESLSATIAGDAVGYLTWAGPFTGEPIRALLMRNSVPVAAGITAGAIERTVYHLVAAGLLWAVLLALLLAAQALWFAAALALSLIGGVILAFAVRRGRRRDRPVGRGRVVLVLEAIRALSLRRILVLLLLGAAQHALLVLEAFVLLTALGLAPSLGTTLIFEAVTKLVNTAGLVVPARLGVSEGGSAALAAMLGFTASVGLSLALMRRIRALIWTVVGLGLLPLQEARARKARG